MAKEWAKPFYNSKPWQRLRYSYIQDVCEICERCGEVGDILHHKEKLTPANIHNPLVTLNKENLEYLCLACHNVDELGEHKAKAKVKTKRTYKYDQSGNLLPPIAENSLPTKRPRGH